MNPYYGTPGIKTARGVFVNAMRLTLRHGQPFRIWKDSDGYYAFGKHVRGTGNNIGITYIVAGPGLYNPIARVHLYENHTRKNLQTTEWASSKNNSR